MADTSAFAEGYQPDGEDPARRRKMAGITSPAHGPDPLGVRTFQVESPSITTVSADEDKSSGVTEYHVVYVTDPEPRWEVQWGKRRMGYQAWDKRVATSAAQDLAKKNRPSKVIIHDRKTGKPESEMSFGADAPRKSKGVKRKLD